MATKGASKQQARLTHFLCLPLVNAASMQQLETSLAAFKAAHQSVRGSPSKSHKEPSSSCLEIPDKAFRPLGTLHLTLGVMSLSKEQLTQATSFLQSLDLAGLMHEAERVAIQSRHKDGRKSHSTSRVSTPDMPLTVSLESLTALPQVDAAKSLYASPVDPTGRLYPFCVMLREKFMEAGFVKFEVDKQERKNHSPQVSNLQPSQSSRLTSTPGDASSHHLVLPKNLDTYTAAITRTPKPRSLLLHATLVNTVYVRERSADPRKTTRDRNNNRMTIDASTLFSKPPLAASALPSSPPVPNNSYIWATEFPLDSICICEMGAKSLDPGAKDAHPLSERLGEQYKLLRNAICPSRRHQIDHREIKTMSNGLQHVTSEAADDDNGRLEEMHVFRLDTWSF